MGARKRSNTMAHFLLTQIEGWCRLKKSNEMQQYADIYLLLNYSTYYLFGHLWGSLPSQIIWSVPQAEVTVLCTPDDGRDGRAKHVV